MYACVLKYCQVFATSCLTVTNRTHMARLLPYLLLYQNRHARFALTVAIPGNEQMLRCVPAVGLEPFWRCCHQGEDTWQRNALVRCLYWRRSVRYICDGPRCMEWTPAFVCQAVQHALQLTSRKKRLFPFPHLHQCLVSGRAASVKYLFSSCH